MKKIGTTIILILLISVIAFMLIKYNETKNTEIKYIEYVKPIKVEKILTYYEKIEQEKYIYHLGIGDSIIRGWGSIDNKTSYMNVIEKKIKEKNSEIISKNKAKNGLTSEELKEMILDKKIDKEIKEATVISISIGGNDILNLRNKLDNESFIKEFDKSKKEYKENLKVIINYINNENPKALIVINNMYNSLNIDYKTNLSLEILLKEWNKINKEVLKGKNNYIILDLDNYLSNKNQKIWYEDLVHPNEIGHEMIADLWIEKLKINYK